MKIFLFSINLILLTSVLALAQPDPPPPDPPVVPLTGLEYLLIGGGAYGIYRYQKEKKRKNNEA